MHGKYRCWWAFDGKYGGCLDSHHKPELVWAGQMNLWFLTCGGSSASLSLNFLKHCTGLMALERMKGRNVHVVWICHYPCHSALAIPHFLSQIRRVRGSLQGENTLLEQLWWANRGLRADFTDQPSTFCSVPLHLASAVLLRSQGVNECQWSESAPSSSLPSLCLLSTGHCVLPGHPALTVCEGASGIFLCVWSVRMVCVWCGMHGVCVCTVAV